jgi:hypothetical protein
MTLALLSATAGLLGCGDDDDDDTARVDAGPEDAGDAADAGDPVDPPAPDTPAPASLGPCAEGWVLVEGGDVATCEPWTEDAPCASDEAHFVGEAGCRRIGTACPEGDWAEDVPDDGSTIWVRAGEPAGGTGTSDAPYGSLDDAVAVAEAGDVIALSRGTYSGGLEVPAGVTVWGACVAETRLEPPGPSEDPVDAIVHVRSAGGTLRNLQITGPRRGIRVRSGSVTLDGVLIDGTAILGIFVTAGASVSGTDVVIRDTRSSSVEGWFGRAIEVDGGATLSLTGVVLAANRGEAAVALEPRSRLSLTSVVVRDTQPDGSGYGGNALVSWEGAQVEASEALLLDNLVAALFADGGSSAALTGSVIRGTEASADGSFGRAVEVNEGGSVLLERVLVDANREIAVRISGDGTEATLTDVVVRATKSEVSSAAGGSGVRVRDGARLEATRLLVLDNRTLGIGAHIGSTLVLTDTVVRGTLSTENDLRRGRGLVVDSGARAQLARVSIEANRDLGILVFGAGSRIEGSDVSVADTMFAECAESLCTLTSGGAGVAAVGEASIVLERFAVTGSAQCGLVLARDASMSLRSGLVAANGAATCVLGDGLAIVDDEVAYRDNAADHADVPAPAP